jgi:hypothetical protein
VGKRERQKNDRRSLSDLAARSKDLLLRACKMRAAASFACAVNERCPAGEIISNLTEAEQPVALISHTGRSAKWYRCMEILWKMALRLILKDIFDVHAESAHSENIISKPEMGPWFCFLIYKHAALDYMRLFCFGECAREMNLSLRAVPPRGNHSLSPCAPLHLPQRQLFIPFLIAPARSETPLKCNCVKFSPRAGWFSESTF